MALLHLAAHPQYIKPLREEVDAVLKEHGWTRRALAEMHKLDSFYRETQRIVSFGNSQSPSYSHGYTRRFTILQPSCSVSP